MVQAFDAGAAGYLLKDCADVELLQAVETVARGEAFLSPLLQQAIRVTAASQTTEERP
jgi:DNA-binding NarL/FixJ family response regulator